MAGCRGACGAEQMAGLREVRGWRWLRQRRSTGSAKQRRRRPGNAPPPPRWLQARIACRALGWRLLAAIGLGLAPLAAAAAFLRNDGLTPRQRLGAAVLGGGAAMALLLASLARQLAARRPPWQWARSLPWSARRRVAADAALLGAPALVLAGLAAGLDTGVAARVLLPLVALLPPLAALAAGAVRGGGRAGREPAAGRESGAAPGAGQVAFVGFLAAGVVALQPWLSAAALALTPAVLAAGESHERRCRVGRWQPVGHLAAGDAQSGAGD
jgi:hypothetical protein